jgi:hypothetical protein
MNDEVIGFFLLLLAKKVPSLVYVNCILGRVQTDGKNFTILSQNSEISCNERSIQHIHLSNTFTTVIGILIAAA